MWKGKCVYVTDHCNRSWGILDLIESGYSIGIDHFVIADVNVTEISLSLSF